MRAFCSIVSQNLLFLTAIFATSCGRPAAPPNPAPSHGSEESRAIPPAAPTSASLRKSQGSIRFATFNASLHRRAAGQLADDLESGGDSQAESIAEVIKRVRPDVLLINEFDYDNENRAAQAFERLYLATDRHDLAPIDYPYRFAAAVNTGEPSGFDMDNDGQIGTAADAIGYGHYAGQYGMVVFSVFPIDSAAARTFQHFLWRDMPGARLPTSPADGAPFYTDEELAVLRLASKSFWDVPIRVPSGVGQGTVHFLLAHPTPPVFDGPEDRNGLRNHDEIRMIADYISPERSEYLVDDAGQRGGLEAGACFVIAGDLNADPVDGQGVAGTMQQLLAHSRVSTARPPSSPGGAAASPANPDGNQVHQSDPAHDTSKFGRKGGGNLRVDYVLPSRNLEIVASGVFWPVEGEPGSDAIRASDHRLVWVDIQTNTLKTCQKVRQQSE